MDFTSHGYFHPQSLYTASPGVGENTSSYGKCKSNPFADNGSSSIPDPLCKLNLEETSEFVRSLPMANEDPKRRGFLGVSSSSTTTCSSSALRRREGVSSVTVSQRKLEYPSSAGNLPSRKSFPSKWDDAERWLITTTTSTTSSHDSHKRLTSHSSNIVPKQCDSFIVDKTQQRTAVEEVFIADKVPTKLVPLSFRGTQSLAGAFHNGVVVSSASEDVLLKDKLMHEAEPVLPILRYSEEPMKEGFIFRHSAGEAIKDVSSRTVQVHHNEVECRDIGTEMTPLGSSTTSRCHTPFKSSSPARNNTPASRSGPLAFANPPIDLSHLHDYHLAKLQLGETQYDSVASYWSSREEEEEDVSKSLRHFETGNEFCTSSSISESRFSLWEEEERMKNCLRYQREEAKIQAWVNLQSAKAEAQSKKLEMKIQKMRSNLEEKLMKRMGVVHRKAEEWRSTAQLQHAEHIRKVGEQAQRMINHDNSHSLAHTACGCFPCTNHHF